MDQAQEIKRRFSMTKVGKLFQEEYDKKMRAALKKTQQK